MKFLSLAWAGAAVAGIISPRGATDLAIRGSLPSSFSWTSTQPVISAKSGFAAIKDSSIVFSGGKYHVFASAVKGGHYSLVYLSFTDFKDANSATFYPLDNSAGKGFAPHVFYFAPQKKWYLVFTGFGASYSTNDDISKPDGWTHYKPFYSQQPPATIKKNMGNGNWVDVWTICDSSNCALYSSDDNGNLYASTTSISSFPSGFSEPKVIMHADNKWDLYEASAIYKVGSSYLLLVECAGKDSWRYFRSWSSTSMTGPWTALAATEQNPFIRSNNVKFSTGSAWTKSFSHGDVVRKNPDQTMTIDACKMQFLYQGLDPKSQEARVNYDDMPYQLALLTQAGGC
ncbi:hypothetical protein E4U42_003463 [Claviceps africana]|uniref:Alpha-L-arabinofuranosidase n=1 Tax=Claviceps africana TaxID=83212 RepID=A0A8K0NPA0_9HYPO|nr:hypothetical protein E4U42_003463 [Claviceps africana]